MVAVIDQLKEEHKQIINDFKQSITLTDDQEAFKKSLLNIKEMLIHHLQVEDREIYTKLRELADSNEEIKAIVTTFITDIQFTTERFLAFISQLEKEADLINLSDKFLDIVSLIDRRIDREEFILFKLYDKYCS